MVGKLSATVEKEPWSSRTGGSVERQPAALTPGSPTFGRAAAVGEVGAVVGVLTVVVTPAGVVCWSVGADDLSAAAESDDVTANELLDAKSSGVSGVDGTARLDAESADVETTDDGDGAATAVEDSASVIDAAGVVDGTATVVVVTAGVEEDAAAELADPPDDSAVTPTDGVPDM
jgi:hypothetical protein